MNVWPWLWIAWIGVFVVLETWAIVTKQKGGTLSENLRLWLGIYPRRWWLRIGGAVLIGGAVWLVWHLLFQT